MYYPSEDEQGQSDRYEKIRVPNAKKDCPECKGTGLYVGLSEVEPCQTCLGLSPKSSKPSSCADNLALSIINDFCHCPFIGDASQCKGPSRKGIAQTSSVQLSFYQQNQIGAIKRMFDDLVGGIRVTIWDTLRQHHAKYGHLGRFSSADGGGSWDSVEQDGNAISFRWTEDLTNQIIVVKVSLELFF